jgi:hypothetical protein
MVDDNEFEAMKNMGLPTSFMPAGVSMLSSQVICIIHP